MIIYSSIFLRLNVESDTKKLKNTEPIKQRNKKCVSVWNKFLLFELG